MCTCVGVSAQICVCVFTGSCSWEGGGVVGGESMTHVDRV